MSSPYKYPNCSKAQMGLFNILHIISTIPPSNEEPSSSQGPDDDRSGSFPNKNKGIDIDLNVTYTEESESSVIDQRNNNEQGQEAEAEAIRDKSVEVLDDRDTQVHNFINVEKNNEVAYVESESKEDREENENEGGKVKTVSFGDNNCVDMLIDSAKDISKKDESNSEEDEKASERNESIELEGGVKEGEENLNGGDVEEAETVVVSPKRKRNRVLPLRYRDSVMEPLKRKRRPSSTSNAKKRRHRRS